MMHLALHISHSASLIAFFPLISRKSGCPGAKIFLYLLCTDVRGPDLGLNEQISGPYANAVYYTRSIW